MAAGACRTKHTSIAATSTHPPKLPLPLCSLLLLLLLQSTGEEFESSVSMLMTAKANVSKRFAGQQHFVYLLEAVAAGLASGPAVGLQKVGEAGWCWAGAAGALKWETLQVTQSDLAALPACRRARASVPPPAPSCTA